MGGGKGGESFAPGDAGTSSAFIFAGSGGALAQARGAEEGAVKRARPGAEGETLVASVPGMAEVGFSSFELAGCSGSDNTVPLFP